MSELKLRIVCPNCQRSLELKRTGDFTGLEYQATCPVCGFFDTIRNDRSGGSHNTSFYRKASGVLHTLNVIEQGNQRRRHIHLKI